MILWGGLAGFRHISRTPGEVFSPLSNAGWQALRRWQAARVDGNSMCTYSLRLGLAGAGSYGPRRVVEADW